jgi:hypothetical protein
VRGEPGIKLTNVKVPVSILIPIKNEATNLPRCLASVEWADEVFVVDSLSTDGSQVNRGGLRAKVVQFAFNATCRRRRIGQWRICSFVMSGFFILDADEMLPAESEAEFRGIVTVRSTARMWWVYWINRRFMFMGMVETCLLPELELAAVLFPKRTTNQLGRYEKLTEIDTACGDNEVHGTRGGAGEGGIFEIRDGTLCISFGGTSFVEKHNRYSNWEARVAMDRYFKSSANQSRRGRVGMRRQIRELLTTSALFARCSGFCTCTFGSVDFSMAPKATTSHGSMRFLRVLVLAKTAELRKQVANCS